LKEIGIDPNGMSLEAMSQLLWQRVCGEMKETTKDPSGSGFVLPTRSIVPNNYSGLLLGAAGPSDMKSPPQMTCQ
jgi:hypothetical protein